VSRAGSNWESWIKDFGDVEVGFVGAVTEDLPSLVSPSGIAFYDGAAFPGWRRSLFVAAQSEPGLVRLTTEGDRVTGEERLLWGRARIRQVVVGPEGRIYLLTDAVNGRLLRMEPAT